MFWIIYLHPSKLSRLPRSGPKLYRFNNKIDDDDDDDRDNDKKTVDSSDLLKACYVSGSVVRR